MGSAASRKQFVTADEVFQKFDEEIQSGVEKLDVSKLVSLYCGKSPGIDTASEEEEKLGKLFQSFDVDADGSIWLRDFFSSIYMKDKDGILSKVQCLRLSSYIAVGKVGGIDMKDAKDLWSKFDIYETSEDHEMERRSEKIDEEAFMKKSLARLDNISLQHKILICKKITIV
eukprot:TRINITY_DN35682_c0_g1_i1.p1 TRINITY_DN35682_c0_g1~~TRINITY_DN35682_c0_g1_i1.p1  ORF type:complete len:185 (-),score=57.35 TRINITY_DN35682_c0_g1_i1:24-539(-)